MAEELRREIKTRPKMLKSTNSKRRSTWLRMKPKRNERQDLFALLILLSQYLPYYSIGLKSRVSGGFINRFFLLKWVAGGQHKSRGASALEALAEVGRFFPPASSSSAAVTRRWTRWAAQILRKSKSKKRTHAVLCSNI